MYVRRQGYHHHRVKAPWACLLQKRTSQGAAQYWVRVPPVSDVSDVSSAYAGCEPQVKCYELSQLAIKFERHMDSEIVDFQILEEDYSKMTFLCADRSVNFHAKYGFHHKIRTPR